MENIGFNLLTFKIIFVSLCVGRPKASASVADEISCVYKWL